MPCTPLVTNVSCQDCPPQALVAPCVAGEPCDEIMDAGCVEYNGPDQNNTGIKKGDRLDIIIQKYDTNHYSNSINTIDSDSIDLQGSGLVTTPLKALARLDPDVLNLITLSSAGLLTKFNIQNILQLFEFVTNTPALMSAFCALNAACSSNSCSITTGLVVDLSSDGSLVIITQPVSLTVDEGDSATFFVVASGTGTLYYQWKKNSINIAGATNASFIISSVDLDDIANYRVVVSNSTGSLSSNTVSLTINAVAPANQAPVANAGADKSITLPTSSSTLSGSGSDSDGTIAAYAWTQISGPNTAIFNNAAQAVPTVSSLIAGNYVFSLQVTDNLGATSTPDTMNLIVNTAGNQAPTANAGTDQAITLPASAVTLTGSGTDTDGTIVSYAWAQVSGPASATISAGTTTTPTMSGLIAGTYVFGLIVMDNSGASSIQDTMTVVVNPAVITMSYGWFAIDPMPGLLTADALVYQATIPISSGAPLVADFRTAPPDVWFVIKTVASQPIKNTWYNTALNNGTIDPTVGDVKFLAPFAARGEEYYVTRSSDGSFDSTAVTTLT